MRLPVFRAVITVLVALALILAVGGSTAAANPSFVRMATSATPKAATKTTAKVNTSSAGNLFVVYAVWTSTKPLTISDTRGNSYARAGIARRWGAGSKYSSQVFYARNIVGGATSVTARTGARTGIELFVTEYAGLDRTAPLAGLASRSGTSRTASTGSVAVTGPGMVFVAGASANATMSGGSGHAVRSTAYGNVAAERQLPNGGKAVASAKLSAAAKWVLHAVAFRAGTSRDTELPAAPTQVRATGASSTQIDIDWASAADNVGVVKYVVHRDGQQVAAVGEAQWSDTGLAPATSHEYVVYAVDAAGNRSRASDATTASTRPAPDVTPPSAPKNVAAAPATASRVVVSWSANPAVQAVTGYRVSRDGALLGIVTSTSFTDTGLAAATRYRYSVEAVDAAGNTSPSSSTWATTSLLTDTTAPSTPTGVTAVANSPTQITVTWAASSDNIAVSGYTVSRDGLLIATVTGTSFQDTGRTAGTSYGYSVRAIDAAGNTSPASSTAAVTTPVAADTSAPSVPTNVQIATATHSTATVTWSASSDNTAVVRYRVYRNGSLVGSPTGTSFSDSGLTASTTYSYRVAAEDAAGNASAQSNTATVLTPAAPDTTAPSIPQNVVATATSATTTSVTWSASTDTTGVLNYVVYRNGTLVGSPTGTTHSDSQLTANTTYTYRVSARDAAGNISSQSAAATITTPSAVATRDPLKQPFASTSIWNMPIGSGAQYVSANLRPITASYTTWGEWTQIHDGDEDLIILRPNAPLTPVYLSNVAWSGGDRCAPQGGLLYNLPMPVDFIVPNSTQNNGAAFLMADGRSIVQTQPFTRCTAGGAATALTDQYPVQDLYGSGITGAHGGSALSTIGGTLRVGEVRPGDVTGPRHALKLNLETDKELADCAVRSECFRWPAITSDNHAVSTYGTVGTHQSPAMKMGSLLAIPPSVDLNAIGLESQPARLIAWTLQNYGTYIVDSGEPSFSIEEGPDGSFQQQFQADWGMSMNVRVRDNTAWGRDFNRLLPLLSVVNNNSASSIGGGGTPRQPLAPEISG